MKLKNRIISILLAAVLCIVQMPITALAQSEDTAQTNEAGLCEHHAEHTSECGYTEETPCGFTCAVCAADSDPQVMEATEATEVAETTEVTEVTEAAEATETTEVTDDQNPTEDVTSALNYEAAAALYEALPAAEAVAAGSEVYGGSVRSGNVTVKGPHSHNGITYDTEWSGSKAATSISKNTNIVLTDDVTFSGNLQISGGKIVNLCLNGKTLDMGSFTVIVSSTRALHICDCGQGGKITSSYGQGTISAWGTGAISISGGTISNDKNFTVSGTDGPTTVTGGKIISSTGCALYNTGSGKMTVTGSAEVSGKHGIYNRNGEVEVSGGTVKGDGGTAIMQLGTGHITISGGTVSSTSQIGVDNQASGSVTVSGDAQISGTYGIQNRSGTVHIAGGTVEGKTTWAIYNHGDNGVVEVSGGTITSTVKDGIYNVKDTGIIYLSGSPSISGNPAAISNGSGSVYARSSDSSSVYTGGEVSVCVRGPSENKVAVKNVTADNEKKFILANTPGGYILKKDGENLVLGLPHVHSWSNTWSSNEDYHWHECEADDCDVTADSQKDDYGTHTPNNDDGDCLTEIKCSKCDRVLTPAAEEHSFTNKASGTLASAADCQNRATYYVQCDNCNEISDTLTVEVGELGEHNFETQWSKDENHHWHQCLVTGCTENENEKEHFSTGDNVATYTKKAVCDECGIEYGEVVPDKENPTGTIILFDITWSEFINNITFSIFCKETQTVEVTTADVGLGVEKAEYIFTETDYASADAVLQDTGIIWNALTLDTDGNASFRIVPNEKGIVYLKITDHAGNAAVIRSDGIVLDNIAPVIEGIRNDVTYCGPVEATVSDEYFALVTVNGAKVTVTDGKFTVASADGKQKVIALDEAGNKTELEITVNDGHTIAYNPDGTALIESCLSCDHEAKAFIGIVGMDENNTSKVYDGQAVAHKILYEGEFLGKDELTVSYTSNDLELNDAPVEAGRYSVNLGINGAAWPASYSFHILKKSVDLPEINSKVYTGETLTADIQDTDLYTVTKNAGGIDVGLYDVELTLKDYGNYVWTGDESSATMTLRFAITKATNEWTVEPSIRGWNYGEGVNAPVATAKFGTVQYTFCDAEGNELTGEPKDADDYIVKVFVPGTDNYNGLTKELEFTIGKRLLTIEWTAPDYLVYDGTAKMPYVEYAGGATDDDEPQIIIELTQNCDNINAGTFTFTATGVDDSNYELTGDLVSPAYTITARPLQPNDFTAAIDGLVFTGSAITPAVESTTNLVTAEDYTVAYENNVGAGDTAKIMITGKRNATGSVEILFTIAKADYPVVWPENLVGNHGETLGTVTLLEGFAWDKPEEVIKYGNGHQYAVTYTPEDTANYKVAQGFATVNGADVTAPAGTVTIGENSWNTLWNDITFGLFFRETQTVTVTAVDDESGINATEYYLAADKTSNFDDVPWTVFEGSFDINPNNKYVVYIRITNGAGYKIIINSNGVVLDNTAPVISGIENGKDVYGDAIFTIDEDNLASVTVDGNNADAVDGKYTITADNAEHTVVVTDKSGNRTEYKLTVYKNYTVTFVADGKEVAKKTVGHCKDAVLPEVPAKNGYTAKWDADGKNITADTTITAEYTEIPKTDSPQNASPQSASPQTNSSQNVSAQVNSPQTGDNNNMVNWLVWLFISGLGIVGITIYDRKKI